jgi:hypothetical protein
MVRADFRIKRVGVRGCVRASVTLDKVSPERSKIFSAWRIRRWRKPSSFRVFLFPEPFPLEFGDFLDEALHLLVIVHRLADTVLPAFGNADLPRFAVMALDQIQGRVQLTLGASAVGFTALADADRQSTSEEPVIVGQLSEPGAEAPLAGG